MCQVLDTSPIIRLTKESKITVTAKKLTQYERKALHHKEKPHTGQGGEEVSRATRGEPTGEEGNTKEAGEGGEDKYMSGGNAVPVDLIKAARESSREEEDQRGGSGPTEETPRRWRALAVALVG